MKTRFDGLDVLAMTCHLQRTVLGAKVVNVYDGNAGGDTYVLKLDTNSGSKSFLVLQSGIAFYDHDNADGRFQFAHTQPSPFCAKLRKHLRGLRLERVQQIGSDRVVLFSFLGGGGNSSCALILELYSKGNLLLTHGESYEILALLRSHVYTTTTRDDKSNDNGENDDDDAPSSSSPAQDVEVRVGKVYPVTYATTTTTTSTAAETATGILSDNYVEWIQQQLTTSTTQPQQPGGKTKKKKQKSALTLKTLLLKPSSGVSHHGPALLEHVIWSAHLPPHQALSNPNDDDTSLIAGHAATDWQRLREQLRTEAPAVLERLHAAAQHETPGYLFFKPLLPTNSDTADNPQKDQDEKDESAPLPQNRLLTEFQPHLLKQHESLEYVQTRHFGQAVADFFGQLQAQKRLTKAVHAERAAATKLQKIQLDQDERAQALERDIHLLYRQATAVANHATVVDQALQIINSALHSGMDWNQLTQLIQVEQQENANPIALLIRRLQLDQDGLVLALPVEDDADAEEDDDNEEADDPALDANETTTTTTTLDVFVSLKETAHANASRLFAQYRAAKEKSRKTLQASSQALQAAQATAQRQLAQAQQQQQQPLQKVPHGKFWFEKFWWMVTRDNYLVLAGRDAHQNELLVKRYLRPGDAYLHADVHGAASVILRAKRRRDLATNKTHALPLSPQALQEAGQFTLCHSSAWATRTITSAWYVQAHQVTKTAPTGEYLTVGSFMVRGKKTYLPAASPLEMGCAVLFRLGSAESIARHKATERRDFMLLNAEEEEEEGDNAVAPQESAVPEHSTEAPEDVVGAAESQPLDSADEDADSEAAQEVGGGANDDEEEEENVAVDEAADDGEAENDDDVATLEAATAVGAAATEGDGDDVPAPASPVVKKRKGLSVRDRKLIKKYGSLEEAERVLQQQQQQQARGPLQRSETFSSAATSEPDSTASTVVMSNAAATAMNTAKRGKKAKLKRQKKKYADQDDEDRELALLLLQGGGGGGKKKKGGSKANTEKPLTETEEQVQAATAAVLVQDARQAAAQALPQAVQTPLAACFSTDSEWWQCLDVSVLEQLTALQPLEAQLVAVTRLAALQQQANDDVAVDNWTASLAGILRTIRKYGHENLGNHANTARSAPGIGNEDDNDDDDEPLGNDDDEIDDTAELFKLTSKPLPEDELVCAVPVCAPYATLAQYPYRVKLTPGNGKRGKAAQQCAQLLLQQQQQQSDNAQHQQLCRNLIRQVADQDWVQAMIGNVKIAAAGGATKQLNNKNANKNAASKKKQQQQPQPLQPQPKLTKQQQQAGGGGGKKKKKR